MFNIEESLSDFNPNILYIFNSKYDGTSPVTKTNYHNHDFLEISIITSGYSNYIIENKFVKVVPGQAIVLNPGVNHHQLIDKDVYYSDIHIGLTNIKLNKNKNDFIDIPNLLSPLTISRYREAFTTCCYDILKEQTEKNIGYPSILKSLVIKLIIIILRELNTFPTKELQSGYLVDYTEKHHIIKSLVTFMDENYMTDISLNKLSKNMYFSPVYISKLFKDEIGYSPINYLIKIRLDNATKLLKSKKYTIKEVSKMVGYNDVYHFSKQFKKHYGFPPSKVIKMLDSLD